MSMPSRSLTATILADERRAKRFVLHLTTSVEGPVDQRRAQIHDLSETGLKLEIPGGFDQVDSLGINLPYLGLVEARIIWHDRDFYGVEFLEPISKAAMSASLLQSRPAPPIAGDVANIVEIALGNDPSLEQITALALELEDSRGATGNRLLGFRKAPNGMIKALVQKTD